jgi:hypothetical protein
MNEGRNANIGIAIRDSDSESIHTDTEHESESEKTPVKSSSSSSSSSTMILSSSSPSSLSKQTNGHHGTAIFRFLDVDEKCKQLKEELDRLQKEKESLKHSFLNHKTEKNVIIRLTREEREQQAQQNMNDKKQNRMGGNGNGNDNRNGNGTRIDTEGVSISVYPRAVPLAVDRPLFLLALSEHIKNVMASGQTFGEQDMLTIVQQPLQALAVRDKIEQCAVRTLKTKGTKMKRKRLFQQESSPIISATSTPSKVFSSLTLQSNSPTILQSNSPTILQSSPGNQGKNFGSLAQIPEEHTENTSSTTSSPSSSPNTTLHPVVSLPIHRLPQAAPLPINTLQPPVSQPIHMLQPAVPRITNDGKHPNANANVSGRVGGNVVYSPGGNTPMVPYSPKTALLNEFGTAAISNIQEKEKEKDKRGGKMPIKIQRKSVNKNHNNNGRARMEDN